MNGLSHKQARRYLKADLDGLLNDAQRLDLQTHLAGCETCRAESDTLSTLTSRLQNEFHERWDVQDGPSKNVLANIHSQTRRIAMSNRINFGLKALAGITALIVLGLGLNFIISHLRNQSIAASENTVPDNSMPVSTKPEDRLLAFTKVKNGNYEIYTIHADGSGLTNLTKNPAQDINPYWSPDGKQIAFESNRTGSVQIYLSDADGSNLIQLTNDEVDHFLGASAGLFTDPWSPDGNKLIISQRPSGEDHFMLYTMDISGNRKILLTDKPAIYLNPRWSFDGKHVSYVWFEEQKGIEHLYVVDANGDDITSITSLLPEDEIIDSWNYYWAPDSRSVIFLANRRAWENDNAKFAVYEAGLEGESLIEIARHSTPLEDWWEGTTIVRGFTGQTLTWLRADGTQSELNPLENCQMGSESQSSSLSRRSSTGYLLYAYGCPNGNLWLYWANPDGTNIKQILETPITITNGGINNIYWSPDNRYVVMSIVSSGTTYMYVLDVDNSSIFEPIIIGEAGTNFHNISWQPIP